MRATLKSRGLYEGERTLKPPSLQTVKVELREIRLNRGYTSNGRYYGTGAKLYRAETVDPLDDGYDYAAEFRAADRKAAVAKMMERHSDVHWERV